MTRTAAGHPALFGGDAFFRALRGRVAGWLKTYPRVSAWVPEDARDAVAVAIALEECGILDRTRLYVTAADPEALERARQARFPAAELREAQAAYLRGGGRARLGEYFAVKDAEGTAAPKLLERMVFGQHNLATDGSLKEFQLIVCRRPMAEMEETARLRAHRLFFDSLPPLGALALGAGQTPPADLDYRIIDRDAGIYRRAS